ncbi:MAG TPA: tetratricopeptide repeat protein, partial [Phormidium sp.]
FELGKYEEGIVACDRAIELDKNWGGASPAMVWYMRGVAYSKLKKLSEALFSYEWAIRLNSGYSLAIAERCLVLSQLEKYAEARDACQQALDKNGDWGNQTPAIAWVNLGRIQKQLKQYHQALEAYEKALAINPQDAIVWTEHGILLGMFGKHSQALTSYEWALKINPKYTLALANRCAAFNRLAKYQEALTSCDSSIQDGDGK